MNNNKSLIDKLENEYNNLINELKEKPKEEVIRRAYELTVKEQIKDTIPFFCLNSTEKRTLLNQKNSLNEFYAEWLKADGELYEVIEPSMKKLISRETRHYIQGKNER